MFYRAQARAPSDLKSASNYPILSPDSTKGTWRNIPRIVTGERNLA